MSIIWPSFRLPHSPTPTLKIFRAELHAHAGLVFCSCDLTVQFDREALPGCHKLCARVSHLISSQTGIEAIASECLQKNKSSSAESVLYGKKKARHQAFDQTTHNRGHCLCSQVPMQGLRKPHLFPERAIDVGKSAITTRNKSSTSSL